MTASLVLFVLYFWFFEIAFEISKDLLASRSFLTQKRLVTNFATVNNPALESLENLKKNEKFKNEEILREEGKITSYDGKRFYFFLNLFYFDFSKTKNKA